jgi:hypothetical protein
MRAGATRRGAPRGPEADATARSAEKRICAERIGVSRSGLGHPLLGQSYLSADRAVGLDGLRAYTALVNDVAVMAAYQLSDGPDPVATAIDAIAGYHAVTELSADELSLLPRLIRARRPSRARRRR